MVTSATFATQSDETGSGLQFLNIILKVMHMTTYCRYTLVLAQPHCS